MSSGNRVYASDFHLFPSGSVVSSPRGSGSARQISPRRSPPSTDPRSMSYLGQLTTSDNTRQRNCCARVIIAEQFVTTTTRTAQAIAPYHVHSSRHLVLHC